MTFTIHIAGTLRGIVDGLPQKTVVEAASPMSIRQLAAAVGVPPILVVLAFANGRRHGLDDPLIEDAEVYLMGPVAGG